MSRECKTPGTTYSTHYSWDHDGLVITLKVMPAPHDRTALHNAYNSPDPSRMHKLRDGIHDAIEPIIASFYWK